MRLRDHGDEMAPELERELEAIDRALAGEGVDAELAELASLATDLRDQRPQADESWAAELDERAEAGFPRAGGSRLHDLLDRVRAIRPIRLIAPAGAAASLLVAVVVGISVLREDAADSPVQPAAQEPGAAVQGDDGGGEPIPLDEAIERELGEGAEPAVPGSEKSFSVRGPETGPGALSAEDAGSGAAARSSDVLPPPGGSGLAPGASKRLLDRSAQLTLTTRTERVGEVSDEAISIAERAGGIVVSSQLSERGRRAEATLQLSIPTRNLDSTLDALTDLATVRSFSEGAVDITKPFVSAQDRLKDTRAERKQLLAALAQAGSDTEAESIRKQLRDARRRISRAEADFKRIADRARRSDVFLTVSGRPDQGGWSLGDAVDDAGDVLRTGAGIALVTAAVVVPLALLLTAAWLVLSAARRYRRERALDEG